VEVRQLLAHVKKAVRRRKPGLPDPDRRTENRLPATEQRQRQPTALDDDPGRDDVVDGQEVPSPDPAGASVRQRSELNLRPMLAGAVSCLRQHPNEVRHRVRCRSRDDAYSSRARSRGDTRRRGASDVGPARKRSRAEQRDGRLSDRDDHRPRDRERSLSCRARDEGDGERSSAQVATAGNPQNPDGWVPRRRIQSGR